MKIIKEENGYRIDVSLGFDPITQKQRRIRKKNISTKSEAENLVAYYKRNYYQGTLVTKQKINFCELAEKYFTIYTVDQKPTYVRTQKGYLNYRIIPYFKYANVASVTKKDCIAFRDHLINDKDKPISNNSINKHMILLKKIFDVAIDDNIIKSNPCHGIKKLQVSKQKMNFWTLDEFKLFIDALTEEEFVFKVFYMTAYFTGIRAGELLALTWEDIDFVRGEIHVNKTMSRINGKNVITSPKSAASNRYITINRKLSGLLLKWKKFQKELLTSYLLDAKFIEQATLFQQSPDVPIRETFGTKKIQRICKRANLQPIRLHDFRHSHVALLINNSEDIVTIKERMGHASITTTIDTYGHLFPNKQKSMSDKFDDLF